MTNRRRYLVALVLALVAVAGTARGSQAQDIPSTPAGRGLKAWLDAFNSGDSATLFAFVAKHQPRTTADAMWRVRQASGGVDFVRTLASEPRHIQFLLKDKGSGNYLRGQLAVDDGQELAITSFGIVRAPPEECKAYDAAPTTTAPSVANPKDVASEDAIIDALYASISGPACQRRDWDRFRSLFAVGARLIPTGVGPNEKATARAQTPDEYAIAARPGLENNGFFEHEIARTGEHFGHIAHAFSTYESRRTANDAKPFARGINSIQLLNDGTRWWIVTVYWQAERPDSPIPAQYLKSPK